MADHRVGRQGPRPGEDGRKGGSWNRGSSNPQTRLPDEALAAVVARLDAGETQAAVAADYGVSGKTIGRARERLARIEARHGPGIP